MQYMLLEIGRKLIAPNHGIFVRMNITANARPCAHTFPKKTTSHDTQNICNTNPKINEQIYRSLRKQ